MASYTYYQTTELCRLRMIPCPDCQYRSWKCDPGIDVEEGYCSKCSTRWRRRRLDAELAMVARAIPWKRFLLTRVMEFTEGSRSAEETTRSRRTNARYTTLSEINCDLCILRCTINNTDRWTKWDWRRDLLELVLSFLEEHWVRGEGSTNQ
jgi:hypothetical protein